MNTFEDSFDQKSDFQPLTFAGGLYDADTELIRFGARDYDSRIGRWTTRDPIGLAGGMNQYAYVSGNPMTYMDPAGLWSISVNGYAGFGGGVTFGQNPNDAWFLGFQVGYGIGQSLSWDKRGTSPDWNPEVFRPINEVPTLTLGLFGNIEAGLGPLSLEYNLKKGYVVENENSKWLPYSSSGPSPKVTSIWDIFKFEYGASTGVEIYVHH